MKKGRAFHPEDREYAHQRLVLHLRTHVPHLLFERVRRVALQGGPYIGCTCVGINAVERGPKMYEEIDRALESEAKKYFTFLQQYPTVTRAHLSAELSIDCSHIYFAIGWF